MRPRENSRTLLAMSVLLSAASFLLFIGSQGCPPVPVVPDSGAGGAPVVETGGAPGIGGTVVVDAGRGGSPGVGGTVVVDAGPPPCTDACCVTCAALAPHDCPEAKPTARGVSCWTVCDTAEDGPSILRWPKLSSTCSTLACVRKSFKCAGGR
jgi:hypothetical protein